MMSAADHRMVIVDDIDSRIQYNGPWFPGSQDSVTGEARPSFRNTLHGTQASASLEFAYHGAGVGVYGSATDVSGPTWECSIDGFQIGTKKGDPDINNNRVLCAQDTVVDGPHILTLNATVTSNQTFWFDEIRYVPSASVPLDQETIFVHHGDPQLQYGQGWQDSYTNKPGSIFTFDFIGVSISWYGYADNGSLATYSIDGQTPINAVLKSTSAAFNQKFFETAQFPAGPHTLIVVYQGNNQSTPLFLNYLVVQNGTLPSTATFISSTSGKSSTPVGAIVGGVIGSLTLIVFAILGFLLLRQHQRRAGEKRVLSSTPQPFDTTLYSSSITPNYSLPLQQSTLAIRKSLLSPLPVSRPSPLPLLNRAQRKAEALAASGSQRRSNALPAMVSMQSDATRSPNVVVHEDSGIRMPATNEIMEVPPLYTIE